ncbi:MAG: hypothetical protein R3185_07385 [Candidatus Thermoplasmatota archaeon]|nr:hypothetical protein [Candidatus Thermoplasmatota archaeon]
MVHRPVLIVLLALTLLPLGAMAQDAGEEANRETSQVTFYGHVFSHGLGAPMPANTEAPVGESNYGLGSGSECSSASPAHEDCETAAFNKLALFSTAGFVDVRDREEFNTNGQWQLFHNERGQTKNVVLDTSKPITASAFISWDTHGWAVGLDPYGSNCMHPHPPDVPCVYPYWGWDPGVYEDVVVKATLYMANLGEHGASASEAPPIQEAIESGDATLIAEGQWGPDQVMNGLPGAPNVNQFEIDLGPPQVDTIPRDQDFFMVYSTYQETNGQNYMVDGPARWWGGEFFAPTFQLPVKNAFDVEQVIPNFAFGKMAILGVLNTPWGSYDVDPNSLELTIEGPTGEVSPEHLSRFGSFSVAHGGHYLPINITWIWDYQKEGLTSGDYTITVSAKNFQHSAGASCTATFSLAQDKATGRLVPAGSEKGVCGLQSASDTFIDNLEQGATQDTQ